jgi:hypothetical protein
MPMTFLFVVTFYSKAENINLISLELQAQTTLINFTVTRQGLEDQLLAEVVKEDRPGNQSKGNIEYKC